MNIIKMPPLTPIFRSRAKAERYAQRIANETGRRMIVEGKK